jgi:hypothetical protein
VVGAVLVADHRDRGDLAERGQPALGAELDAVVGDPDEFAIDVVVGERGEHLAAEEFAARRAG